MLAANAYMHIVSSPLLVLRPVSVSAGGPGGAIVLPGATNDVILVALTKAESTPTSLATTEQAREVAPLGR